MPPRKKKIIEPVIEEPEENLEPVNEEETFTFKRSHFYAVFTVLAFAAGVLVGYAVWGYNTQPTSIIVQAGATPTPIPRLYEIETAGFPSLGPADAPVVIVEFSDYQCPFCTKWYREVYRPLLDAYPGKIRLVFRNYPLSFHQNAFASAEAALCAGDKDMAYAGNLPPDSTGESAVGGTSTFFINGQRLGGAYPLWKFKEIIDAELAKSD